MDLQRVINAVADEADDFLAGVSTKKEAQPAIREFLSIHYRDLSAADSAKVAAGVLALLDREGFFEVGAGPDAFIEDDGAERAGD